MHVQTALLATVVAEILEHGMQALLDIYTILREVNKVDNVRIALVGDLANGRTARSLAYLLSMYKGIKMYFVAPDVVRMGEDIKQYLTSQVCLWQPLAAACIHQAAAVSLCMLHLQSRHS